MNEFNELVNFLTNNGYVVTVENVPSHEDVNSYKLARVSGKGVVGAFCESNNGESYTYLDGRFAFDNNRCFNKWSSCPFSLKLPSNILEFGYILDKLEFIGSDEGFEKSSKYKLVFEDEYIF